MCSSSITVSDEEKFLNGGRCNGHVLNIASYILRHRSSSKFVKVPVQCINIVSGGYAVANLDFTTIQKVDQILTIFRTCISEPFHHNPITLPHGLSDEELNELESVYYTLTLILYDLHMGDLEKKRIYDLCIIS